MRKTPGTGLIFIVLFAICSFVSFSQRGNGLFPGSSSYPAVRFSVPSVMAGEQTSPPALRNPAASTVPSAAEEAKELPLETLEKITVSYGVEDEYFTVQAASYPDAATAERGYAILENKLREEDRDHLRIEVVGSYHTLRLGKFEQVEPARTLVGKVKKLFPTSFVLSAYVKPEQIKKIYSPQTIPESGTSPPAVVEEEKRGAKVPQEAESSQSVQLESAAAALPPEVTPEDTQPRIAEPRHKVEPAVQQETGAVTIHPENIYFKAIKILDKDERGNPLRYPSTVFYDPIMHEIYVIDSGRVLIFDADYAMLLSFGKGRGVGAPQGIYVDAEGRVYVCQAQDGNKPPRLTILNPALFVEQEIFLNDINGAANFIPERIALGRDSTIYLVGPNTRPGVLVLDSQGNFLRWLQAGDPQPDKRTVGLRNAVFVKDIEIDDQGRIYLLSEDTSKIYVYSPEEEFLFSFGQKGGSSGKTSRPRGLSLDRKRQLIYVVDYMRHTILIYDFNGTYLTEFGGIGYSEGWFYYPNDIAVDDQGRTIIADFFNRRVQILEMKERN